MKPRPIPPIPAGPISALHAPRQLHCRASLVSRQDQTAPILRSRQHTTRSDCPTVSYPSLRGLRLQPNTVSRKAQGASPRDTWTVRISRTIPTSAGNPGSHHSTAKKPQNPSASSSSVAAGLRRLTVNPSSRHTGSMSRVSVDRLFRKTTSYMLLRMKAPPNICFSRCSTGGRVACERGPRVVR